MEAQKYQHGTINWMDLTVPDAYSLKEFYKKVIGWTEHAIAMKDGDEDYEDYAMLYSNDGAAGGICHLKGKNQDIPSVWMPYISVDDIEIRKQTALDNGATLLKESFNKEGLLYYAMFKDPAGAAFAMIRI